MNADLKKRILPAIIYVVVIVGATLMGNLSALVLIQIFSLICIYEFVSNSFKGEEQAISGRYVVGIILLGALIINLIHSEPVWTAILWVTTALYTYNGVMIITRSTSVFSHGNVLLSAIALALFPFLLGVHELMSPGLFHYTLLGVFIILWLNDAGAYFVGRAIGRNKIHPSISPGKTWEGWIGGVILGIGTAWVISQYMTHLSVTNWIVISVICGIMGILGDLTESAWKRKHKIKDSGSIMPGHGGFLDRLDSFIYSIPFVILYLSII